MDFLTNPQWIVPILAAAAAWGGSRQALNGTRERVRELHVQLADHIRDEHAADMITHDRIARIETKVDLLLVHKDNEVN